MAQTLAFLAAIAFAFGSVLQQRGTLDTDADEGDPRFLLQALRQPVWLFGAGSQAAGWILQATALDRGPLVVVQSISALSLVIALPLGVWFTHQRIGAREVAGALLTLVGILFFLSAGQPQGGTSHPAAAKWWVAGLVTLGLVVVLGAIGMRFQGAAKALTLGAAAGLGLGLQAAVTKTFVTEIGNGVLALLTTWSTYVLIVSAVGGFILLQTALKTGVLAPAMASSNSVTLFSSVILGITVYGERLSQAGGGHSASTFIGLAVAIVGIALLAGAAEPDDDRDATTSQRAQPA
jgi:drug/metabolite transporter (DMT)-like permease